MVGERAAIYARVSSREQKEGYSLDAQVHDDREYCTRQGYSVRYVLKEVGSGRDPGRPKMLHILKLAEQRKFDVLVVWRRNRFGRSSENNPIMERFLRSHGVRVEAIIAGPQSNNSYTRFMNKISDAVDELEVDNIAERCMLGKIQMAREGLWPTKAPYGWRRNYPRDDLLINDTEASAIRECYRLVTEGATVRDAMKRLGWANHQTVMNRIHNPAYKGHALFAGVTVPLPAIVAPEAWEAANLAVLARKRNHNDEALSKRYHAHRPTPVE